jgi:hypothetical protein
LGGCEGEENDIFYLSLVFILLVQDNMVDFNFGFIRSSKKSQQFEKVKETKPKASKSIDLKCQ